jgi:hypothetical protein
LRIAFDGGKCRPCLWVIGCNVVPFWDHCKRYFFVIFAIPDRPARSSRAWHPKPVEEIADSGRVSIHGHIWLNEDALELEVNSTARAARGKAFIQSLLGQYLGYPLTVHENLEKALEESDFSAAPDPMDLNANPEVQALLQA